MPSHGQPSLAPSVQVGVDDLESNSSIATCSPMSFFAHPFNFHFLYHEVLMNKSNLSYCMTLILLTLPVIFFFNAVGDSSFNTGRVGKFVL